MVLLAGMNGAGKSTLLRTIMGLSKNAYGTILVNGKSVEAAYDNIAYMADDCRGEQDMRVDDYGQYLALFYKINVAQTLGKLSKGQ